MQVLNPQLPSGKNKIRQVGDDAAGAVYVAAILGGAALVVAWGYRYVRGKTAAARQLAAQTAQSAATGLQSLLE